MSLFPAPLKPGIFGIPGGRYSKVYVVDPVNGDDDNLGTSFERPLKTLEEGYSRCTDARHDTVLFVSGATADNPAASITWSKNYTHLIGLSSDVYGLGQRCRVVALAATDLDSVITFSGSGCIVKNMQFNNEHATGTAEGVALVTGMRNFFENCFFMAPTSSTAASFSLKDAGAENVFKRCTIGQYTNARGAASYGLWLHKGVGASVCRSKFVDCEFLSWGATADHCHVRIDADIATVPWMVEFEGCLFANVGTALTQAIDDNSTAAGHQVIFRGRNNAFLNSGVVGDVLTYMFAPNPDPNVSGLLMVTVAES